ncbi:MAG: hypothetical protein ABEI75_00320 [Halobaculum sp.]
MTTRPPTRESRDGSDPTPLVELLSDTSHAVLYDDGELVLVTNETVECSQHGVVEGGDGDPAGCTHSPPAADEVTTFRVGDLVPLVLSSEAVRAAAADDDVWIDWFATHVDGLRYDGGSSDDH